ncbi:hypothetical protein SPRG_00247 [Saprolegnia parasitica CBS 223.65]|uniref:N-acetyltransferase domain-containing protein n=1 Tax=Saprolegnia parasitica (strain CBS 223.65) TaxID=695850 RepID=A0A067D8Q8_SAPPC|nr:hypothetical protein SPRG_00247 [Saprolegnia parasitica CBS 223.65]KDO35397.1 hypothetical protein SPRG_00247 [Saprolegnia parasitica CBS 223.65]|eukprot:XP_012193740.1 hypothetical protein SPRG_00247 [Saprolegnia parasitica CBS 223.65]
MSSWVCCPFDELSASTLYDILHLRCAIFVVGQESAYLDLDHVDKRCLHLFYLSEKGSIMAYARLLGPGAKHATQQRPMIGRVLTAPSARGKGLGKALVTRAIAECRARWPNEAIEIGAQSYLRSFYEDFGFRVTSAPYMHYSVEHMDMVRDASDAAAE